MQRHCWLQLKVKLLHRVYWHQACTTTFAFTWGNDFCHYLLNLQVSIQGNDRAANALLIVARDWPWLQTKNSLERRSFIKTCYTPFTAFWLEKIARKKAHDRRMRTSFESFLAENIRSLLNFVLFLSSFLFIAVCLSRL